MSDKLCNIIIGLIMFILIGGSLYSLIRVIEHYPSPTKLTYMNVELVPPDEQILKITIETSKVKIDENGNTTIDLNTRIYRYE